MAMETTTTIDKFLGLHQDSTEGLNIAVGELAELQNIRITETFKMRKREGYSQLVSAGSAKIDGMWYGKLGNTFYFVIARSGTISTVNLSTGALTSIGTLTAGRAYFFAFNDKLYIQNGAEYKSWTGAGNIADVAGYIPKVAIGTPPTGGGTPLEDINTLTGKKHQTFNGNNSATTFQLLETSITSVDSVYVNGVLKTVTTHYTVNTTNGTVTFTAGNTPPIGTDNVDIYWTKGTGNRTFVTAHKQSALFGGANDSRVFMYGVDNKIVYSALGDGVPSAEYFPENNYLLIGSDEYNVTHLSKQYDRLIIHKEKDTHYCVYDYDVTLGASFPTYPLNDSVGNIAFGEGRNVLNNPFIITSNGVFQFTQSNVRDERNAQLMSSRVNIGLQALDLSTAITFDWEKNYEYFVCVGSDIYVYNYKIDVWYYFKLADIPSCFMEINGTCYFGTSTGKVMKFDTTVKTDAGTAISSMWKLGYLAFGANYVSKFLNFGWVGLQPQGKSKCVISWESDKGASSDDYIIVYALIDFGNVNFADYSFDTNSSPKPFRLKLKVKKFSYMTLIGKNNESTYDMTILNITLPVTFGGMAK